jgi:flotillin
VKATGNNSKEAVLLLIVDKLPELVKTQVEAIKNIRIDKITVWENGGGKYGKSPISNFISGMYKAVPPLQEVFNMAGMDLPEYLKGKDVKKEDAVEVKEDKPKDN